MLGKRFLWASAMLAGAGLCVSTFGAGCSASNTEPAEDDEGSGGETAMGGGGGQGGGGGAGGNSLCKEDCSAIDPPTCFKSVCNDGTYAGTVGECVIVEVDDGVECDDGEFCTTNDTCQGGQCTGGPQNDCGMDPPECETVVCDEDTDSCSTEPIPDGDPCTPDDLCVVGATCSGGLCTGGTAKDCFFEPVPNECHVSVCDPADGMCKPQPGNDGDPCVDQNDLCSVGNTCNAGVCSGGSPKDCSHLTQGCFDGVCDPATGQCVQQAIMPGDPCAEATDDCNQGICDTNGNCNPMPVNEGGACNSDHCVSGQTCNNGTCQGGSQVTSCTDGDLCCPSGCTISTDNDCLTEITLAALNNGHNGDLGGVAGADSLCTQQAAANGIGGTWKAFLSSSSQDVKDIVPQYLQSMPVKNLDGVTFYNDWSEVFTTSTWIGGGLSGVKIKSFDGKEVDESTGANPEWEDADGWHGSTTSGAVDTGYTCSDWTSTSGSGRNGEWDFGNLIRGTYGQETHTCSDTLAVACVRVGP